MTWLNDDRFYTYTALAEGSFEAIATELGANDPNFNLRRQQALVLRAKNAKTHAFVSLLEPHGEYNGPAEYTTRSSGAVTGLVRFHRNGADIIRISTQDGSHYLGLSYTPQADAAHSVKADGLTFAWRGYYGLFDAQGVLQ